MRATRNELNNYNAAYPSLIDSVFSTMAFTIGLASLVPEHSWICYTGKHQKKDLYKRRMSTPCSIVKNENQICQSLRGVRDLAQTGQYKAWFLDQFGVLHDGQRPYRGAIATLEQLAQTGIKIVIISNSSRRALTTLEKMRKLGFDPSLFDGAITSGELTHQYLLRRNDPWFAALGRCCIHMTWSERGAISLEGLGLQIVEDLEAADFILAHGTEAIGLESGNGAKKMELEKLEQILENAVDKRIPMIVANPDHVTVEARALRVMPGTLGTKYEQLGGQVRWMGKPDQDPLANSLQPIMKVDVAAFIDEGDQCQHIDKATVWNEVIYKAAKEMAGVDAAECIAVGDSLHHDILGANNSGMQSVFVAGGIHASEVGINQFGMVPDEAAVEALTRSYGAYPSYIIPSFIW